MTRLRFFYILRLIQNQFFSWRKKPRIVYMNAGNVSANSSSEPTQFTRSAQSVPASESTDTAQSVPVPESLCSTQPDSIFEFDLTCMNTDIMNTPAVATTDDVVSAGSAEAQAVAAGVDQKPPTGRKSRVRKTNPSPRVAIAKKKKEPKPPRNPFRRSETGKLQLKSLQMGKRVETMTPRVTILRERLETMQSRLDFVSGKLKLVKEELETRETANSDAVVSATTSDDMEVSDELALENALEEAP
jgi:hypothetical protein